MTNLGHVVFYVKDLERSVKFYQDVVGLSVTGKIFNNRAAVLTGGSTHHELLLIEVKSNQGPVKGNRIGLYHVGWKIGESLNTLKERYQTIVKLGYEIIGTSEHTISQSIYLYDPDGNEIEVFVDNPQYDWKTNTNWMEEPVKPLYLD